MPAARTLRPSRSEAAQWLNGQKGRVLSFDAETEHEPRSTATDYFARDIDGDTRADLLLGTISGGISKGSSTSRIHLNPGRGVDPSRPPDVERIVEGGFSTFMFVDVDGDGLQEIITGSGMLEHDGSVRWTSTSSSQERPETRRSSAHAASRHVSKSVGAPIEFSIT